jgi:hypothetical protein
MYIKLNNGVIEKYPYSINELKKDNLQTSFPEDISDEMLVTWNVFPVKQTPQPSYDYLTQTVTEKQPVNNNGWTQVWEVINLPLDKASANVRERRDYLLSECDWVVIKSIETDVPEIESWKTYRQALRDVPSQTGFPYSVVWPIKP